MSNRSPRLINLTDAAPHQPVATVTLADIVQHPEQAASLSVNTIPPLLCQLSAIQTVLAARLAAHNDPIPSDAAASVLQDRLLTIAEVAELLVVPRGHVYDLAKDGTIPTVRVGKKYIRVRRSVLLAWLTTQEQKMLDMSTANAIESLPTLAQLRRRHRA